MTVELADLGVRVNHKRDRPAPDLVQRHFKATHNNQLWVADMTYIPAWAGFLYLVVVMDVSGGLVFR